MKLLVDMKLSPRWIKMLADAGIEAVHWSSIGAANAPDPEIVAHARDNDIVMLIGTTLGFSPCVVARIAMKSRS